MYTDRCESVPIANQIQRIYERRLTSKVFPGDTSRGQSFVHRDDVVDAFRATVARRARAWVQDQIPAIEEPFIKPWMIDLADDHYALDVSRARALLGWSPRRSLREALPKMVTALKSDPEAFYRLNKLEGEPAQHETATAAPRAYARRAT